jgi:hypothetical protein
LRLRYTPHRDIDPSALGEQGGGLRVNAIHAVEREPRIATKDEHIAGIEAERLGWIAALAAAYTE